MGCGQQKGHVEVYRGVDIEVNLLKKVRIEIAVNEAFVDDTIDAIILGAKTGSIGDGKIFVLPIEKTYPNTEPRRGGSCNRINPTKL